MKTQSKLSLELPNCMPACPVAWIRFFNENLDDGPKDRFGDVRIDYINRKLKSWNARYVDATKTKLAKLKFDSKEDLLMFILRWSL